ncbi:hypothetical protein ES708_14265 [subsurface metagenome]
MKAEFALKHIIFFDREFCLMSCNYISSWANNCQLFDANLHKNEQCRPLRCKRCLKEVSIDGEVSN